MTVRSRTHKTTGPRRERRSSQRSRERQVAEARWQSVLATMRDAIISIDAEGHITFFNPAAEQVFGYGATEVLGKNVQILMPSPYQEEHDQYIRRHEQTGEARAIGRTREVQARRKSGEVFPIELSVAESSLGDERLYTAIIRDVTERQAEQLELRELQRVAQERARLADIGAITAKIVHDLGNPLAALSMQAQLILRRARRGDFQPVAPVLQPAEQLLRTLGRMETLVHEFTDFARDQRLNLRALGLRTFLASCVELWQALAAERRIELKLGDVEPSAVLRADEAMLRRVLDNLIKNAIEAMDRGPGQVIVSGLIRVGGKIRIAVEDSGPGVQEGIDVFKLFETTKAEGTGIGLAVARQIVTAHGGTIEHVPRDPRGTIFQFELPLSGPASRP